MNESTSICRATGSDHDWGKPWRSVATATLWNLRCAACGDIAGNVQIGFTDAQIARIKA